MKNGVIFDVDGTLYNSFWLKFFMFFSLSFYYIFHINKFNDLLIIKKFRLLREKEENEYFEYYIRKVSKEYNKSEQYVDELINRWMFVVPLKYIRITKREKIIRILQQYQQNGYKIIIYSDYNPVEKLKALNINADYIFFPSKETFKSLKPNSSGLEYIISQTKIGINNLIYYGDRESKDGAACKKVGIKFINVRRPSNEKIYKNNES